MKNIDDPALIGRGFSVFLILQVARIVIFISKAFYKIKIINKTLNFLFEIYKWFYDNLTHVIIRLIQLFQALLELALNIYLLYTIREVALLIYSKDIEKAFAKTIIVIFLFGLTNVSRTRAYLRKVKKFSQESQVKEILKKRRKIGLTG